MTQEDVFLADILDAPEDDLPRQIYADWLMDRGDGPSADRGEFIHIQCQLAHLPPGLGPPALVQRERQLREAHHREWGAPFQRLGCHCWEYQRGFVMGVGLTTVGFVSISAALFRLAPVRSLKLYDAHAALPLLATCPLLGRIHTLDLENNGLGDEDLAALVRSPHLAELRTLLLWSNQLGDATGRALAASPHLPALTRLDLSSNALGDGGLIGLIGTPLARRLELLDLRNNLIGDEGAQALLAAPLDAVPRQFDLGRNRITDTVKSALLTRFAGRLHLW